MKASALATEHRPALDVIVITPGEWCTTWPDRPDREVAFGLRLPSDMDESNARREATEQAGNKFQGSGDHDGAVAEWNDALMALYVAACICDPNDYRNEPEHQHHPADTIRHALRSECIARIFQRIERLKVEQSPASTEADDDDVAALGDILLNCGVPALGAAAEARIRRHVAYILEEIEGME